MVEERRTVRDSSGHEETTVTRRMVDKSHVVSTIRDEQGRELKREVFNNVDKGEINLLVLTYFTRERLMGQSSPLPHPFSSSFFFVYMFYRV